MSNKMAYTEAVKRTKTQIMDDHLGQINFEPFRRAWLDKYGPIGVDARDLYRLATDTLSGDEIGRQCLTRYTWRAILNWGIQQDLWERFGYLYRAVTDSDRVTRARTNLDGFVLAWWQEFGDSPVYIYELAPLWAKHVAEVGTTTGDKIRFGLTIRGMRNHQYAGFWVYRDLYRSKGLARYSLSAEKRALTPRTPFYER